MQIGLIGYGVVGKAAYNTFSKAFEVVKYDKYQSLNNFEELLNCDFVFITVPTPFDCEVNQVDESAIIESLSKLEKLEYNNIVNCCFRYLRVVVLWKSVPNFDHAVASCRLLI